MQTPPATIVIVDDASEVRSQVRTQLRVSGLLQVVGVGADGADAVALAERHRPALMLLDVSMPHVDGLEALPRVLAVSPTTRVVLYSGFEEQGLEDKALELGAVAFVAKSTPVESLAERLVSLLDDGRLQEPGSAADAGDRPSPADRDGDTSDSAVLEDHLERFREVFDEAAIGMATMTLTGHLVRANRALAGILQVPPEGLVGVSYATLLDSSPKDLERALLDIREQPVASVQLEHGVARATDRRRVCATLAPVRDSGGRALYVFLQVQDVTAEQAALEALRSSEERFRLLVEAVEDYAIFMLDPTGHIVSWNAGAERTKGYTAEEILGQHFRVFYPPEKQRVRHPENELEIALREGHYFEEGWRVRKDGTRFWGNVLITAVFDDNGRHIGFAKVTRDGTQRRQLEQEREHAVQALAAANSELEKLNERLRQAAEDQSQFLAVTAHELRTPIGVLGGSAQTLSDHWAELTDEERSDLLDAMTSSTGRLRRLLTDLLTASRLRASALDMRREVVAVGDVLADAVTTARRTRPDAEILLDAPEGLAVAGDRERLSQAVENLLTNALLHGEPPVRVTATSAAATVEIRVSDSGAGVPTVMLPRLFDRFATGRRRGGTGLGLFIVRELARAHGGDAVYEPPGPGRPAGSFLLRLPAPVDARP
jgi:PAS domain S-box-containing protein